MVMVLVFKIFLLLISQRFANCTTKLRREELESDLPKVYRGCNELGSGKLCFGISGQSCWTTETCTQGITLFENKTHIQIRKFQASVPASNERVAYAYGISVDPFTNNGMSTSKPVCRTHLTSSDFIVRIFNFPKTDLSTQDQRDRQVNSSGRIEGVSLLKSDWERLCREEIVKEYNSKINTFDTRYIVFQNKFYFDIDIKSLESYAPTLPGSVLEDFKDPDLYSTVDGRLYLNFNPNSNEENSSTSAAGTSRTTPNLLFFFLPLIGYLQRGE